MISEICFTNKLKKSKMSERLKKKVPINPSIWDTIDSSANPLILNKETNNCKFIVIIYIDSNTIIILLFMILAKYAIKHMDNNNGTIPINTDLINENLIVLSGISL